jgi:hypothetical protein
MKRGQLRPNPDKVRDWLARSRAKSSLNRSGRPARTKRKRRRPVPSETRALVLARGLIERLGGAAEVEAFRHHLPMSAQEPGRAEPGSR